MALGSPHVKGHLSFIVFSKFTRAAQTEADAKNHRIHRFRAGEVEGELVA